MKPLGARLLLTAVLMGSLAMPAAAQSLRLDPPEQTLSRGQAGSVSLRLDSAVAVRSIELTLQGDPALITAMGCVHGGMFSSVPCMVWESCEFPSPGVWHGFAVIIGSTCQTTGPGELLRFTFTGGVDGSTTLQPVSVVLYGPNGIAIPGVTVDNSAHVVVGAWSPAPVPAAGNSVALSPNPFNPAVEILLSLTEADDATVRIFDLHGRQVAAPLAGPLPAGETRLTWRGRDDDGRALPSGTYLFVLETSGGRRLVSRGTLLR